jgi:hypothetical protein
MNEMAEKLRMAPIRSEKTVPNSTADLTSGCAVGCSAATGSSHLWPKKWPRAPAANPNPAPTAPLTTAAPIAPGPVGAARTALTMAPFPAPPIAPPAPHPAATLGAHLPFDELPIDRPPRSSASNDLSIETCRAHCIHALTVWPESPPGSALLVWT